MPELDLEINEAEIKKIKDALTSFSGKAKKEIEVALKASAKVVQTRAKQLCQNPKIKSKITVEKPTVDYLTWQVRIKPKHPLAHIYEFGTGIFNINQDSASKAVKGYIKPKFKKIIRFVPKGFLQRPVFTIKARGVMPKPFMRPADESTRMEQVKRFHESMAAGLK